MWDLIDRYYSIDASAERVNLGLLKETVEMEYPKHSEMLCNVIDSWDTEPSVPNIIHICLEKKKERNSIELGNALATGNNQQVTELFQEREMLLAGELEEKMSSDIVIAPNLKDLFEKRSAEHRISFTPAALNNALEGGALPGHHVLIFGVTDIGKTLTVLDNIRCWIEQGKKVLYVCNEDPVSDLVERILVSITGKDKWMVRKHYEKAEQLANNKGWQNLVWAPLTPGSPSEIEALTHKYKPDVVVVDQVRNLNTGDKDAVHRLENAAKFMRNLAKRYSLLSVSVSQGADSASGRAILDRGDVDNSNVGLPGATDLMLGVGATAEMEMQGTRVYSFPKNKVSGNKTPVQVFFNTKIMRAE